MSLTIYSSSVYICINFIDLLPYSSWEIESAGRYACDIVYVKVLYIVALLSSTGAHGIGRAITIILYYYYDIECNIQIL